MVPWPAMAKEKRRRQRAARQAKAQKTPPIGDTVDDGSFPDVPDAEPEPAAKPQVEVVAATPDRSAKAPKDAAAADARRQAVRNVRLKKQRNLAFRRFAIIMAAIVVTFIVIGFLLQGDDTGDDVVAQDDANYLTFLTSDFGTGECADGTGPVPTSFEDAPQQCIEQGEALQATFETSLGTVVAELNTIETFGTANNFVNLARSGYYDGLEVFRTDPLASTVASGAATNDEADPGPGYTIADEAAGFVYGPGMLAMSRSDEADSAGSAYFFTVGTEAEVLDAQGTFVVFGQVTAGLDVLESILDLHIPDAGNVTGGRPSTTVTVNSVTIAPIPSAT